MMMRPAFWTLGAIAALGAPVGAQPARPDPSPARIEAAARKIVAGARYAAFVTLDDTGRPRTRQVEPRAPDSVWTVWFATNPKTRKVSEIARDPRVVLHYFDAKLAGYVSLVGQARIVRDRATKDSHWAPKWSAFYRDRDSSVVLVEVRAERLEVVCAALGIEGDKGTWLPPSIRIKP